MCKEEEESNFHPTVECIYTRKFWNEIERKVQLKNPWKAYFVKICLKEWCLKEELKEYNSHMRYLPQENLKIKIRKVVEEEID